MLIFAEIDHKLIRGLKGIDIVNLFRVSSLGYSHSKDGDDENKCLGV
jgi:hypothetical protein